MPMGHDPDDDDDVEFFMGVPLKRLSPKTRQDDEQTQPSKPSRPAHDQRTSHGRFWSRLDKFKAEGGRFPRLRHLGWWWLHNLVAHIAIGLLPIKASFRLHDWTSERLNLKKP